MRYSFFSFGSCFKQPVTVIVRPVIFAGLSLESARFAIPTSNPKPTAPVANTLENFCIMTSFHLLPGVQQFRFQCVGCTREFHECGTRTHGILRKDRYPWI